MGYKLVAQEHTMGCGVACVASLIGTGYEKAMKLFNKRAASARGYYFKDIIPALKKSGLNYKGSKVNDKSEKYLKINGSIIFIKRSEKYPKGHYLLKTNKGWMNPWMNYPKINPARAGFQKKLPGKVQWILYKS